VSEALFHQLIIICQLSWFNTCLLCCLTDVMVAGAYRCVARKYEKPPKYPKTWSLSFTAMASSQHSTTCKVVNDDFLLKLFSESYYY
jgi:hypothetical protein